MNSKAFVIQYKNTYFGYRTHKKSFVFTFNNYRNVSYVKKHIKYEGYHIDDLSHNQIILLTHFNPNNDFDEYELVEKKELKILKKDLYNLSVICNMNNVQIAMVQSIYDREDGDLQFILKDLKKIKSNSEIIKYNLDYLIQ